MNYNKIENTAGIYMIKSKSTGRMYIGQTVHLNTRLLEHERNLRGGYHFNSFLQRCYDKYGPEDFEFSVIEYIPNATKTELKNKEVYYISKYNTFEDRNHWNLTAGGDATEVGRLRKISLKNIHTNEIVDFNSFSDAERFVGCQNAHLYRLIKGEQMRVKDWCLPETDYSKTKRGKKETFKLYHDDYGEVEFTSRKWFSQTFNIPKGRVTHLLNGWSHYSRTGWRSTKDPFTKGLSIKNFCIYHPIFGLYNGENMAKSSLELGMYKGGIGDLCHGVCKTIKGWRLPTSEEISNAHIYEPFSSKSRT